MSDSSFFYNNFIDEINNISSGITPNVLNTL